MVFKRRTAITTRRKFQTYIYTKLLFGEFGEFGKFGEFNVLNHHGFPMILHSYKFLKAPALMHIQGALGPMRSLQKLQIQG